MESFMNMLFSHADQDNISLNNRDEVTQRVKTTDSSAQTSDEQCYQILSEVTPRGKLPMLPAEYSCTSIANEQRGGGIPAQANGPDLQMMIKYQIQLKHFMKALSEITMQHDEIINQFCTNGKVDQQLLDKKGKNIAQKQAVLQNMVEQLGNFHPNTIARISSCLDPSFPQAGPRPETQSYYQHHDTLEGSSTHAPACLEGLTPPKLDLIQAQGSLKQKIVAGIYSFGDAVETIQDFASSGPDKFEVPQQSPVSLNECQTVNDSYPTVPQYSVLEDGLIERPPTRDPHKFTQPLNLPNCPSIPEEYRDIRAKRKTQRLILADDQMVALVVEQQEEPENTSDPRWWKEKAEAAGSSLWGEYGHTLGDIMLQNEKENKLQHEMVANARSSRVDNISLDEEVLQWLRNEGEDVDGNLSDQKQPDSTLLTTEAVELIKQELVEKHQQLLLSQQETSQLKQQLQLLQIQGAKGQEENKELEVALEQAQGELERRSEVDRQKSIDIQNAHQEELAKLQTKVGYAEVAIEEARTLKQQITKLQDRHKIQLEVQATKSREQWEQNGLLSDENEALHIQVQRLDMQTEQQLQEIEAKQVQVSQLQESIKETQAQNSQLEMGKTNAEAQAELLESQKAELEREVCHIKQAYEEDLALAHRKYQMVDKQECMNMKEDIANQEANSILESSVSSVTSVSVYQMQHTMAQTKEHLQGLKQDMSQLQEDTENKLPASFEFVANSVEPRHNSLAGTGLQSQTPTRAQMPSQQIPLMPQISSHQIPPGFPAQPRFAPGSQAIATGPCMPQKQQQCGLNDQQKPLNYQENRPGPSSRPVDIAIEQSAVCAAQQTKVVSDRESQIARENLQGILPTYKGGSNVGHFLLKFSKMVDSFCINEKDRYVLLVGQIKGIAEQWLTQQPKFGQWNSSEIMTALKERFENIQDTSVDRLESLVWKGDLHKFNTQFFKIGSGCLDKCPEFMQKRIYIRALRPHHFQLTLHGLSIATGMSLAHLMATAVELQPFYKRRPRHPRPPDINQRTQDGLTERKSARWTTHGATWCPQTRINLSSPAHTPTMDNNDC